jgi:uncharacterized RDD family membrane protein YckC
MGAYAAYNVWCHARWGQTVGKRVAGIRVVSMDGEAIGWRQALLRHAVDIAAGAVMAAAGVTALLAISPEVYEAAGWTERARLTREAQPVWAHWARMASYGWVLSELVVLLLNEKKRALHDYLAGTVVVILPHRAGGTRHP